MPEPIPSHRSVALELLSLLARERIVLLLLFATFGLIAWQHWGMERTVVLDVGDKIAVVSSVDDHSENGTSVCEAHEDSRGWWLQYDVRQGTNWSFCGLNLAFRKDGVPISLDWSNFDSLVIHMVEINGPNVRFQVQIKVDDRRLLKETGIQSMKYLSMIGVPNGTRNSHATMTLDRFVVPTWWAGRFGVPSRNLDPIRKEVREIEFMTSADQIVLGTGSFGIQSLELRGKWIRQEALFKLLFAAWLAYVVGGLAIRLYKSLVSIRNLQRQATRLQELAERDPLTLLHNRRGLENHLKAITERAIDPTNPVIGVMMIDLDHFKSVNDTLGHDAGDDILRNLARIIQEDMRPNNLAARWGGEEFILLLPGIPPDRVLPAAEGLRCRVESDLHCQNLHVTASIGVAHGRIDDFDTLVKRADEALYRAKTSGRNRVETAI
ncbi:MAG TPA: GGDEF domain-containing protein [Fibrobacteria bacterium]|nr:GGDEF domain-containing protein [Fibrobacteria bacterium]